MRRLKALPAAFLLLAAFNVSAMAQFFGECRDGSVAELSRNIKAHSEHTFRMEEKFLAEYYWHGPLPKDYRAPTLQEVQGYLQSLGDRQAAVLFYAYDENSQNLCSWLISANGITSHRAGVQRTQVRSLQPRLMNSLGVTARAQTRTPVRYGESPDFFPSSGEHGSGDLVQQASNLLIPPPIEAVLQQGTIDTLIVVPIFRFGTIPYSVLKIGDKPAVDTVSVLVAPGLDAFSARQQPPPRDFSRSVIVGDPAYDDPRWHLPSLPGARAEAVDVGKLVGSKPLIGAEARIGKITELLQGEKKDPGLIYLATHAMADSENPLDGSRIWLSGTDHHYGRWTPREIQWLPLSKGHPLVVLSACQTGLGKNFGVGTIGMARAWRRAGASSVVMSLWSVSDDATRRLMTHFIRRASAKPPDKALREAMQMTRQEFPEPFNWAGFTVFGLPAPAAYVPPTAGLEPPSFRGAEPPSRGEVFYFAPTPRNGGRTRTGKAGEEPPKTPEQKLPETLWNLWAEELSAPTKEPTFNPVPYLKQGKDYLIALDLSAINYQRTEQGTYSQPAGTAIRQELQKWLDAGIKTVKLTAVIIVDPLHFEKPSHAVEQFIVDLRKIRKVASAGIPAFDNLFEFLKQEGDPDFVFGRAAFRVKTRTGRPDGVAPISLSLWANNRPIDEISVQLCVASTSGEPSCQGIAKSQFSLKGVDSLRVASEVALYPDAAFHFLELDDQRVFGVFRRNDEPGTDYVTWPLHTSPADLRSYLSHWVSAFVATRSDPAELYKRGIGLYNLLFPPTDPQAEQARAAWEAFARPYFGKDAGTSKYQPPSLFIRLLQTGPAKPLLVPLGLTAVPLDNNNETFLGFFFRIESPLDIQSYHSDNTCLSRWVTVVPEPAGDDAMKKATSRIKNWIPVWEERGSNPFDSIRVFGDWIIERKTEGAPTALVILSHHANDMIWSASERIFSREVVRKFSEPSVVLLSGCGTGGPGAADFIRQFNLNGIESVIATSTEVDAYMAGDFLNEFAKIVDENKSNEGFNLAIAYFRTIQRLRKIKPPGSDVPYGARALEFTLLGNGNIRLCPPEK